MENGEEGIMDFGEQIKVIYIDGKRTDGTEHISFKIGEFIKSSNGFFCMLVNSQEILIPSSRIIRIEKIKKEEQKWSWWKMEIKIPKIEIKIPKTELTEIEEIEVDENEFDD